ncbi:hypothetical protein BE15_01115 [Sorangium cellulosum]|uniref:Uncharacterized protein n=1 Tax=Sorangium cellulosum TaxID=56 RepID=A0A150QKW7_SORCE|nr:hypothetical protein BE15_01115 [Sorangium cellulosum]
MSGDAGWSVDVVLPPYGKQVRAIVDGEQPNACSAVLRVTCGGIADHVHAARRAGSCRALCTQLTSRCHDRPDERLA